MTEISKIRYNQNGDNMEDIILILGLIIVILLLIIIILIVKKKMPSKTFTSLDNLNNKNIEELLNNAGIDANMENSSGPIKLKKIIKQQNITHTIYKNGEKISEKTMTNSDQIHSEAFTNCPNCGAKIESNITNCPYCNTLLTNLVITKIEKK